METEDTAKSPTATRSKSNLTNRSQPINDINLNGEDEVLNVKSNSSEKDEVAEDKTADVTTISESTKNEAESTEGKQPNETKLDKPQGRKRKASEMKSTDENVPEEPPVKDKPPSKDETPSDEKENKLNEKSSDDGLPLELKELKDLESQTFGKGKRARIPNKRYSDFPLKSTRSSQADYMDVEEKIKSLENGETKESTEHEVAPNPDLAVKDDTSEKSSSSSPNVVLKTNVSLRTSRTASPATPSIKKSKAPLDLSNPNYLKPFQFGWKRELVYRATNDASSNKRNGDIYYYTPSGKKVRSMREVSENLKNKELTLDDFTFFKEPLGLDDPDKEIIRDAKIKSASSASAQSAKKSTPKVTRASKVTTPKPAPPPPPPVEAPVETKPKSSPRKSSFKIRLHTRTAQGKSNKKNAKNDADMEIGTFPPNWTAPIAKKTNKTTPNNSNKVNKPYRTCSIRCQGISGLIPTLQCRICLCLYHHECTGHDPFSEVDGYVCKNCQPEQDSNSATSAVAPSSQTPINSLKSVQTPTSNVPNTQQIPETDPEPVPPLNVDEVQESAQPDVTNVTPSSNLPPQTSLNKGSDITASTQSETKSIVGSVTTWFPSSSTIQVSGSNSPTAISDNISVAQQRPQFVEFLGNKQFLVIPKHNIVAVSQNIPSATAPTNRLPTNHNNSETSLGFKVAAEGATNVANIPDSASLGPPVEVSTVKTEPSSSLKCTDLLPITSQERTETECSESVIIHHDTLEKRPLDNQDVDEEGKKKKPKLSGSTPQVGTDATEDAKFMDSYLQNVAYGYNTLLYVFQYLKMQDLLRASCVCSMWRDIASHPMLWRTVRMKNSQIHSFEGLADALEKHGTIHLDLRKMLLPSTSNDDIWLEFSRAIKKVDSLRKIELCRCPATVVEQLALSNPKLEVINSVTIKCESMSLAPMVFLKNLQELRLKSTAGFALTSDLTALSDLKQLKHLSLTSIKELNKLNINVIADLRNLESLELGECTDFPKTFGSEILTRLSKLEKLRLEKGQGNCYTFEVLEAVKNMPHLYQLELVNFDIKPGFDLALGACPNIKKLLIIPTYISQSATTNHMVLGGVLRLQSTLSQFVWGVTLELLRVTELFVDQCEEDKDKKEKRPMSNGDSIPVLKPVPLAREGMTAEILPAQEPPQVEILPLPNLQKLLLSSLPTTRVKILKIPFHATWRQSIHDSVN